MHTRTYTPHRLLQACTQTCPRTSSTVLSHTQHNVQNRHSRARTFAHAYIYINTHTHTHTHTRARARTVTKTTTQDRLMSQGRGISFSMQKETGCRTTEMHESVSFQNIVFLGHSFFVFCLITGVRACVHSLYLHIQHTIGLQFTQRCVCVHYAVYVYCLDKYVHSSHGVRQQFKYGCHLRFK